MFEVYWKCFIVSRFLYDFICKKLFWYGKRSFVIEILEYNEGEDRLNVFDFEFLSVKVEEELFIYNIKC